MENQRKIISSSLIIVMIAGLLAAFAAMVPSAQAAESNAAAKTKLSKYLLKNIKNHKEKIDVSKYNTKFLKSGFAICDFYDEFLLNYPESYPVNNNKGAMYWTKGNKLMKIGFKYTFSKKEQKKAQQKYSKELNKIVKNAKKKKKVQDRIRSVNSQMCKLISYNRKSKNSYNAYGAIVEHKAVCMGYALAFKAAMDKLKIPCKYGKNLREDHLWNKVRVGKKWYVVDVTWNDATKKNSYLLTKKHPLQ